MIVSPPWEASHIMSPLSRCASNIAPYNELSRSVRLSQLFRKDINTSLKEKLHFRLKDDYALSLINILLKASKL